MGILCRAEGEEEGEEAIRVLTTPMTSPCRNARVLLNPMVSRFMLTTEPAQ